MKYKKTPLEVELQQILTDKGKEAMVLAYNTYFLETIRTKGFQLITEILRSLDEQAMRSLRIEPDPLRTQRLLGNLSVIDAIRNSMTRLLPASERPHVDWLDEEEEDYLLYDQSQVEPGGNQGPIVPGAGEIPGRES